MKYSRSTVRLQTIDILMIQKLYMQLSIDAAVFFVTRDQGTSFGSTRHSATTISEVLQHRQMEVGLAMEDLEDVDVAVEVALTLYKGPDQNCYSSFIMSYSFNTVHQFYLTAQL